MENTPLSALIEAINRQKKEKEISGFEIINVTLKKEFMKRCWIEWERISRCSLIEPSEILGLPIIIKDKLDCDFTINNNKTDNWNKIKFWSKY